MNTGHHDPLHPDAFGAAATTVPPAPPSAPGERDDALPQDAAHDSPPQDLSPLPAPAQDAAARYDYTAPAVSAAAAAAEFVARIFADAAPAEGGAGTSAEDPPGSLAADHAVEEPAAASEEAPQAPPALAGKQVLVLGLGASGLAMARWCVRCGAQVTVADTRSSPPQLAVLRAELPQVEFIAGAFDETLVQGRALHAVYRSPGLSPNEIAPVVIAARARQISVEGELGLYAQALRELRAGQGYAPAVLAITGTNGKTTVTSLTGLLVECADKRVAVAGNIGPTLLDTLAQHIDAGTLP